MMRPFISPGADLYLYGLIQGDHLTCW